MRLIFTISALTPAVTLSPQQGQLVQHRLMQQLTDEEKSFFSSFTSFPKASIFAWHPGLDKSVPYPVILNLLLFLTTVFWLVSLLVSGELTISVTEETGEAFKSSVWVCLDVDKDKGSVKRCVYSRTFLRGCELPSHIIIITIVIMKTLSAASGTTGANSDDVSSGWSETGEDT